MLDFYKIIKENMICARVVVASIVFAISTALVNVIIEKTAITYYNPEYVSFVNVSTRRFSRRGVATSNVHAIIKHAWGNNITVELVFYEFLSNEYRRSFVQVHGKVCEALSDNPFLSPLLKQTELVNKTCPYPAGEYHLTNITIPSAMVPSNFPYRKFRVDLEITPTKNRLTRIVSGHTYVEVHGKYK